MTYIEFITNILKTRGRFNCGNEYHERHHITPKCMGGTNDDDNLIDLFAREHFIAHRLLALENCNNEKLVYAWWCMCSLPGSSKKRIDVTAEEYEEARKAYAKKFSGNSNPSSRKVIRLSDDKIYSTVRECYIDNNISSTIMYDRLKQHREFSYYDEWIAMPEYIKDKIKSIDWKRVQHANRSEAAKRAGNGGSVRCSEETKKKIGAANSIANSIAVYCIELDNAFSSIKDASLKTGINKESIRLCLCGKQKHAGKHPVTGEKLTWVKLENKNC